MRPNSLDKMLIEIKKSKKALNKTLIKFGKLKKTLISTNYSSKKSYIAIICLFSKRIFCKKIMQIKNLNFFS